MQDLSSELLPTLLFAHVVVAIGSIRENTHTLLLCGVPLASTTALEKFRSLAFGNDSLDLQQ